MTEAFTSTLQIHSLRLAQGDWSQVTVQDRARIAKRFSELLADQASSLHAAIQTPQRRDFRETLSSEILPLADAARWLGRNAKKILRDRRLGWSQRPLWLGRVVSVVSREPVGVVLVIGTWNYPLFLTGVQMLQAIVAGNAVVVKPAVGCEAITESLRRLFVEAGVPENLIGILDTSVEAAERAIDAQVDKIVMTGSSQSGRKVLARLANQLTPSTMELSGCDSVFVLDDADLNRVVAALLFGLRLNGGATCLAPRRVYVPNWLHAELRSKLMQRMHEVPCTTIPSKTVERILAEMELSGATLLKPPISILHGEIDLSIPLAAEESMSNVAVRSANVAGSSENIAGNFETSRFFRGAKGDNGEAKGDNGNGDWIASGLPIVLDGVAPSSPLAKADIFAPLLMLFPYETLDDALQHDRDCPYGLASSIFGDEAKAKRLAATLQVGSVVINDVIAPTADPRLPCGGVRESGFGVTRGPEGLLELTRPKVVSVRKGRWLPHLDAPKPQDEALLEGILQWMHGATWRQRLGGLLKLMRAGQARSKK